MRIGDSIEIASGVARDTPWRVEMVNYGEGHFMRARVRVPLLGWVELCEASDQLHGDDVAQLGDDIACALAEELAKAKGIEVTT